MYKNGNDTQNKYLYNGKEITFGVWTYNFKTKDFDYKATKFDKLDKNIQGAILAFENTKSGKAYLAKYAKAKDKIGNIEFESSGSLSNNKLILGQTTDSRSQLDYAEENGNLEIGVQISTNRSYEEMKHVEPYSISLGHEVFIHADVDDDELLNSIQKGRVESDRQKMLDTIPQGVYDHNRYLRERNSPESKNMRMYTNQLKNVLNPDMVDKHIKEHDTALKSHTGYLK